MIKQVLSFEFEKLDIAIEEIVKENVRIFHNKLIDKGEDVHITRTFKRGFKPIIRNGVYSWTIENKVPYAGILARGRRLVNGKMYGSEKWYYGIDPMISTMVDKIEKEANALQL
jgi:hypothetical protein